MRADLHTHTIFSDGKLIPSELIRRALVLDHNVIAITDHVDMSNIEFVVSNLLKAVDSCSDNIVVIPGVEITHVAPAKIGSVAKKARELGAEWVIVHGETVVEPVSPGTNFVSVTNPEIDMLAHPGFITIEEAEIAVSNNVALEITGRAGHNITNGHVANVARIVGADILINSDTHSPENLMDEDAALAVALGAGLTKKEADKALHITPYELIKRI